MQVIEKYKWLIVAGAAVIVLGGLLVFNSNETVPKDDGDVAMTQEEKAKADAKKAAEEKAKKAAEAAAGKTTYTAQPGDSYTVMARHAVQDYAKAAGTSVSRAQIVAAETFLTTDAKATLLEIGQKVTFDKGTVAKAVKKAKALSSAELAAWQVYVPYVNFDTSHVS